MFRQQGIGEVGDDGSFVPQHTRKQVGLLGEMATQVVPDLSLDGAYLVAACP